ncbi:WD domain, G-beta repeat protein [Cooperia oncophora]
MDDNGNRSIIRNVKGPSSSGHIVSVSDRHHKGPITVLKRVTTSALHHDKADLFLSGGSDGKVVIYCVEDGKPVVKHLTSLGMFLVNSDIFGNSFVKCYELHCRRYQGLCWNSLWHNIAREDDCGRFMGIVFFRNFEDANHSKRIDDSKSGVRVWWLERLGGALSLSHFFEIDDLGTIFAVAADMQVLPTGTFISYSTTMCHRTALSSRVSRQSCWHKRGQDSYVKLWRIEEEKDKKDADELNVTKNCFKIADAEGAIKNCHHSERGLNEENSGCDVVRLGIVGGQAAGFFSAAFSPDAQQVVASSYFGGLYAWLSEEEADVWDGTHGNASCMLPVRDVAMASLAEIDLHFFLSVRIKPQGCMSHKRTRKDSFPLKCARPQVMGHRAMPLVVLQRSSVLVCHFHTESHRLNCSRVRIQIFGDSQFPHLNGGNEVLPGLSNKKQLRMPRQFNWRAMVMLIGRKRLSKQRLVNFVLLPQKTVCNKTLFGLRFTNYMAMAMKYTLLRSTCGTTVLCYRSLAIMNWGRKNPIYGKMLWLSLNHLDHKLYCLIAAGETTNRSSVRLIGHQLTVTQFEWCPTGTRLLSVSRDRKAIIYREQNDDCIEWFLLPKSVVVQQKSTLGSYGLVAGSRTHNILLLRHEICRLIIIWKCNDENTAPVCSFKCQQAATSVAVCCGTGLSDAIIAGGLQDGSVLLLHLHENQLQPLSRLFVPSIPVDSPITRLRVNPRDRCELAVAGSDGKLRVLRLSDLVFRSSVEEQISCLIFIYRRLINVHSGVELLALGTTKRTIDLYCGTVCHKAMKRVLSITAHDDWVHSIAFNQSSPILLATAGQDSYVKLWRIEEEKDKKDADELNVTKNCFKIADAEGELSWSISTEAVLAGHDDWVHSTSWDKTGRTLLTSSSDKTVIIWKETHEGKLWSDVVRLGIVGGQAAGFFSAAFSPDAQQVVASSYFGGLYAWLSEEEADVWDGAAVCSGHVGAVRDVAWHPCGKMLISVGEDKTTRVDLEGFVEVARPQVHGHSMQCIAVVSRFLETAVSHLMVQESLPWVCLTKQLRMPKQFSWRAMVMLIGRKRLSKQRLGELSQYGIHHFCQKKVMMDAFISYLRFFSAPPTEDCLQQNTLWPEIHKLYGHGYEVYAIAINPAGTVLATSCKASQADDAVIALWDTSDWSKKSEVSGHQLTVTQFEWCPTGTRLLSVSRDRKAIIYREQNDDCATVFTSTNGMSEIFILLIKN